MHPIDLYGGLIPMVALCVEIILSFFFFSFVANKWPTDYAHEPFFYRYWRFNVSPLARLLDSLGVTPNMVTIGSTLLTAIAAALIATDHMMAAMWMLILATSCDTIDGFLARLQGSSSKGGAFLDSYLDRISEGFVFGGIAYLGQGGLLTWLAFLAVVSSFSVSYARARAEALGVDVGGGLMQRPLRMVIVASMVWLSSISPWIPVDFPEHIFMLVAAGSIGVFGMGTATRRAMTAFKQLADESL